MSQAVRSLPSVEGLLKQFLISREAPTYENVYRPKNTDVIIAQGLG